GAAAGRALHGERAVERLDAVDEALEPRAPRGIGAADAIVDDFDDDRGAVVVLRHADLRKCRLGVLRDVRERLGGDVVRGGLDRRREALVRDVDLDRNRGADHERLERRSETAVGEDVRVEAARQLPELLQGLRELDPGGGEDLERLLRLVWPTLTAWRARDANCT